MKTYVVTPHSGLDSSNAAQKEIISQTDQYLVNLSSKTNIVEDYLTKYSSV